MAAFVQTTGTIRAAGFSGTNAGSFGSLPTVGNHVVVGIALYDGAGSGISTVTDNQGNTYVENAEVTEAGGGNSSATIYSTKVATSSGTYTVTVDPVVASGLYIAWGAAEFSGLDATTHLDRTGTDFESGGSSDASVTASAANTTAAGVSVAVAALSFGDTDLNIGDTPPTGYTNIAVEEDANSYMGLSFVYKVYSSSETSAAAWTHDNTSQFGWTAVIATYKAAAGGSDVDITDVGDIAAPVTFGTSAISASGADVNLTLAGLAVATAFGTATVAPEITLTLTGVAVPVAFGTTVVAPEITLTLAGIAVATAFGTATVAPEITLTLTGVAVPTAMGTAIVAPEAQITLTGLAVPVSFVSSDTGLQIAWAAVSGATEYRIKHGAATGVYTSTYDTGSTATTLAVSVLGLTPGAERFLVVCPMDGATEDDPSREIRIVPGVMRLSSINQLAFSGLAVPTAFGDTEASVGGAGVSLTFAGLAVSAAMGTAVVAPELGLTLTGLAVPAALGTATVAPEITLTLAGLAVSTALGEGIVGVSGGPVTLSSVGDIAVPTAFGTAAVAPEVTLTLTGVAVPTALGEGIVGVSGGAVTLTGVGDLAVPTAVGTLAAALGAGGAVAFRITPADALAYRCTATDARPAA